MGTIANVSVHTKYYASIAQSVYPDVNTNYLGFVEYYESPPNETGTYIDMYVGARLDFFPISRPSIMRPTVRRVSRAHSQAHQDPLNAQRAPNGLSSA